MFYSNASPSGENVLVDFHCEQLQNSGYQVTLVSSRTEQKIVNMNDKLAAAARVATGHEPDLLRELKAIGPDVIHVHNLFPNFGVDWAPRVGIPIIATIHNYRSICAGGMLFRKGGNCLSCVPGQGIRPLTHACYRGSRIATLPLWVGNRYGVHNGLLRSATRLIVLSERARRIYSEAGIPEGRMQALPNPTRLYPLASSPVPSVERWLYLGRLSEEKGIAQLVTHWPNKHRLDVVGDGPLSEELRRATKPGIRLLGRWTSAEVAENLSRYTGLVFSSMCAENAPMTFGEALSRGLPVLALAGNSVADAVQANKCGRVMDALSESNLREGMKWIVGEGQRLRDHCLAVCGTEYTAEAWMKQLDMVYESAWKGAGVQP